MVGLASGNKFNFLQEKTLLNGKNRGFRLRLSQQNQSNEWRNDLDGTGHEPWRLWIWRDKQQNVSCIIDMAKHLKRIIKHPQLRK